jgi:hypothetical protein
LLHFNSETPCIATSSEDSDPHNIIILTKILILEELNRPIKGMTSLSVIFCSGRFIPFFTLSKFPATGTMQGNLNNANAYIPVPIFLEQFTIIQLTQKSPVATEPKDSS